MIRIIEIRDKKGLHQSRVSLLIHILTGYDYTIKHKGKEVFRPYFQSLIEKKIPHGEELEIEVVGKYAHIPVEILDRTEF